VHFTVTFHCCSHAFQLVFYDTLRSRGSHTGHTKNPSRNITHCCPAPVRCCSSCLIIQLVAVTEQALDWITAVLISRLLWSQALTSRYLEQLSSGTTLTLAAFRPASKSGAAEIERITKVCLLICWWSNNHGPVLTLVHPHEGLHGLMYVSRTCAATKGRAVSCSVMLGWCGTCTACE